MGIKGINELIRKFAPDAFFILSIEELKGKRIAIDGNLWMHTNMATSRKKVIEKTDITIDEIDLKEIRKLWILALINFIIIWLSYNITPVFVVDGNPPKEKDETRNKRREDKNTSKIKIDNLYLKLKNGDNTIINELKKELRNHNPILPEDYLLFREILKSIGIPCLQAIGDGEQLCSMLCLEGKVAAVWSNDTDNLVYGCPLLVTKFNYDEFGNRDYKLCCVRIDKVLNNLKISFNTFVDLCIMCGCDFNVNIPGIGSANSYKLLLKYNSIDFLPENINTECLKYKRCREIFNIVKSTDLIKNFDSYQENFLDINIYALINSREIFESLGIFNQTKRLMIFFHNIKPSENGLIEHLKLELVTNTNVLEKNHLIQKKKVVLRILDF